MKLREQHVGHMFSHSWKMLSKLELGPKTVGLTYSVVLPTTPEWIICDCQTATTVYIRALQGHSQGVAINPDLFSSKQILWNWKELILHTGGSSNYKSILEDGLWAGGLSPRCSRQACIFSALNPQDSSCHSERSTGKDQMIYPKWYCTSTVIAQTTIAFITSFHDVLKTQI